MIASTRNRPTWVWDPNPFNPYGAEVARVIAANRNGVVHISRRSSPGSQGGFRRWRLLPPAAEGKRSLIRRLDYAGALFVFVAVALIVRPLIVIPWVNSTPEAHGLLLLQRAGLKTFVVVHNPIQGRDDAPPRSRLWRLRLGATSIVVHTPELRLHLPDFDNVVVAHHPAYFGWIESLAGASDPARKSAEPGDGLLYIGSARADKGFYELPRLSTAVAKHGGRLRISVGRLSGDQFAVLKACDDAEVLSNGESYVSDADLFRYMSTSGVLIAPYRDVTVSGTIILALSMGIRIVAFRSAGLDTLIPHPNLVEPGNIEGLAARGVTLSATAADESSIHLARELDRASIADWLAVLPAKR